MRLFEWHSEFFGDYKKLPKFINYLSIVWENRNQYLAVSEDLSEEEAQERNIQKQRFFDFTVDGRISARNYVGVVQYEDIRIEVYPKIFAEDEIEDAQKWQMNLLYWLTYCRKIRFPFSFAAVSTLNFDDYLELLIYIFANYTEEVISRQPFQSYHKVEEETTFLKGSLLFDDYTKHILTTGKWQNFYCSHQPFVYDNQFNRIIKYVTRRLLSVSENYLNREKLVEILFILNDVTDLRCISSDCDKVKLNPLFEQHKEILELCRLFLSNQMIDMDNEDSRNFCFLVPMEYIFEDFIFGFISEKWPSLNIKSQSKDYLALSAGSPVFQIRNDIYVDNQLIIDTKYKRRIDAGDLKAGVSQVDLYQMVSYALKRKCVDALLLYPYMNASTNTPSMFQVHSGFLSQCLNMHIRNIDITFDDIREADNLVEARIKEVHPIFL